MSGPDDIIVDELLSLEKECNEEKLSKVWEALTMTPDERLDELAELYVDFTQKNGLLLPFISAVIKREVESTKQQMVLFREDCFAIKCINRVLFSDLGKKYLVKLVTPLVASTLSYSSLLEITSALYKDNRKQFDKNVDAMVSILTNFLNIFAKSQQFCPILFREIFAKIQQFVNLKFGKDNNSPLVLDFIFFKFICPAIIHPKRYQLVAEEEELSANSLRSLINVSKVLNNLAHNIDEKFEEKEFEKLKTFIGKNHSILIEKLTQLVDPVDIERTKAILSSNIVEPVATPLEKQEVTDNLRRFLRSIFGCGSSEDSSSISGKHLLVKPDSPQIIQRKVTEIMDLFQDANWKHLKTLKTVQILCHPTDTKRTKVIMTVKVGMKKMFDYLRALDSLAILVPTDTFINAEPLYELETYKEFRLTMKYPAPLSNREYLNVQWDVCEETRCMVIINAMPSYKTKDIPRLKGFVRGEMTVCWLLEKSSSSETLATFVVDVDPKGAVPAWAVNYFSTNLHSHLAKLKPFFEKNLK